MTRRILFSLVAVIGSVLGLQGSARADIFLELKDDNVGDTLVLSHLGGPPAGNIITFNGVVGNFDVGFTAAASNAPGAAQGRLDITNLVVSLVSGAGVSHTLTIAAKAVNFLNPPGSPLAFESSVTTTFRNSLAGDKLTFESWFDDSNTSPITGTSNLPAFMVGQVLANTSFISPGGVQNSFSDDKGPISVTRGGFYALSNVTMITISSTATTVNTTGASVVSQLVPEPSGMALAGLGALGMIGYGLRRRKVLGA
jgi:hypothetical protein